MLQFIISAQLFVYAVKCKNSSIPNNLVYLNILLKCQMILFDPQRRPYPVLPRQVRGDLGG